MFNPVWASALSLTQCMKADEFLIITASALKPQTTPTAAALQQHVQKSAQEHNLR